jgi:hypothetical protein
MLQGGGAVTAAAREAEAAASADGRLAGHIVIYPGPGPHRTVRMGDVILILADTVASVRMQQPLVVYEPPGPIHECAECWAAYAEARKVIREAGGVTKWVESLVRTST